ncbi:alpha/beta hydrolase [Curtobacterium sp. L1-20]|uniref:alpha/beta hydrolase n=1 Tax=Curtobacterium sp. L1-20 TaxID=3138181 RepID=UPI003B5207B3
MGVVGIAAGAAALAVVAAATAAGAVVAKKAIHPRPKRTVTAVDVDATSLTVRSDEQTRCPGVYRVYFDGGQRSILVGDVLSDDGSHVRRKILGSPAGAPVPGDDLTWSGYLLDTPGSVSSDFEEVSIAADGDVRRAWYFPIAGATTWAIHVHGIHSGRQAILRAVPDTLSAGMSSLVIGYRGDLEDGRGLPATFGTDEWHDLDAAMHYAVDHGAERLVLVGWSMGATIALHAAARSSLRRRIDAMVLICPALDWFAALRAGAVKAGFPAFLGTLGALSLTIPGLARVPGLRKAIPMRWMRPSAPAGLPTLLIHSSGDRDVPIDVSKRFAATPGAEATLVEIPPCPHGMELNRDPALFHGSIAHFLSRGEALSAA